MVSIPCLQHIDYERNKKKTHRGGCFKSFYSIWSLFQIQRIHCVGVSTKPQSYEIIIRIWIASVASQFGVFYFFSAILLFCIEFCTSQCKIQTKAWNYIFESGEGCETPTELAHYTSHLFLCVYFVFYLFIYFCIVYTIHDIKLDESRINISCEGSFFCCTCEKWSKGIDLIKDISLHRFYIESWKRLYTTWNERRRKKNRDERST